MNDKVAKISCYNAMQLLLRKQKLILRITLLPHLVYFPLNTGGLTVTYCIMNYEVTKTLIPTSTALTKNVNYNKSVEYA